MRLYLVQHGQAIAGEIDPDRPLTDEGSQQIRTLGSLLADHGVRLPRIRHSGKTRARQTAELLAAALSTGSMVEAHDGLKPNDPIENVAREVDAWTEDTMLVGHLPFMDRLLTRLITGREEDGVVAFQPGTIVCLEDDGAGAWRIGWVVGPALLAADP